jgi:hypothetical protein
MSEFVSGCLISDLDVDCNFNLLGSFSTMSLLQGVLRSHTADSLSIEKQLKNVEISRLTTPNNSNLDKDDSDDDLVNVVCRPTKRWCFGIHKNWPRFLFQEPLIVQDLRRRFAVQQRAHFVDLYTSRHDVTLLKLFQQRFRNGYSHVCVYGISPSALWYQRSGIEARRSIMVRSTAQITKGSNY